MRKQPVFLYFVLMILASSVVQSCALPAGLTAKLPFLNRLQPVDCSVMRVGILIGSESDPLAQEQLDGYELALQQINDNGGVAGCDLQVFYQNEDENSTANPNPRQTYQAVRSLVEEDEVLAFTGGTTSAASMVAASLANYFSVPMLVPSAGGAHILPEENRSGFRLHASEAAYAGMVFELIKTELGSGIQTVMLFEDTTFGHDAAIAAVNAANQNEQDIVGYFFYDPAQTGSDTLAKQVVELQPQLVYLAFSQTAQAENILRALEKEKGALEFIEVARSGGFASHEFLRDTDVDTLVASENLLLAARWSGEAPTDSSGSTDEDFADRFAAFTLDKYGEERQPSLYNAEAYKALMILGQTLDGMLASQATAPLNIQKLREDLRQALFNYKEVSPVWGSIDFSSGGQNQSGLALMQMSGGKWQVVYPVGKADADLFLEYQPR